MASRLNSIASLAVAILAVWAITAADSANNAAPAPAADCSSIILNLADCLTFVTNGSTTTKPEGTCCSGLKTVLKTNAECLCEGLKNSAQLGVVLNVTKAVSLPSACHVSAPSISNCGLSTGSISAPAPSPLAGSPGPIVASPPVGTAGPNGAAPAPAQGDSAAPSALVATGSIAAAALTAAVLVLF